MVLMIPTVFEIDDVFFIICLFLLIIISKVDNNLKYKVMCQQICIYIIVKTVYLLSQK